MKKLVFVSMILPILFLFYGCVSTPLLETELEYSDDRTTSNSGNGLFIVSENSRNDIAGTIYEKSIKIYDKNPTRNSLWGLSISFTTRTLENTILEMLGFVYVGEDWRFYDNIQIKIGDEIFSFDVENPWRNVSSGGTVGEIGNVWLSQEAIEALKNCTSIIIQINGKNRGEPITIDKNGMEAINNFFMPTE
jgi:hypothetical protein